VPAAADRGHRFSLSDWVIAALAHEIGGLVWSLDADFVEMERLAFVARFDASPRANLRACRAKRSHATAG
jgi:hypothetical protein